MKHWNRFLAETLGIYLPAVYLALWQQVTGLQYLVIVYAWILLVAYSVGTFFPRKREAHVCKRFNERPRAINFLQPIRTFLIALVLLGFEWWWTGGALIISAVITETLIRECRLLSKLRKDSC